VERSFLRIHNRCAKNALREEAVKHHKERIPLHFQRSARQKYGYQPRKEKYMRFKARVFRSVTDLVKRGKTKDAMTQGESKIRLGGKAADENGVFGGMKATLELPFPIGTDAQKRIAKRIKSGKGTRPTGPRGTGVTIPQMKKEIATIIPTESRDIAQGFLRRYGQHLARELARAPRIRKRVAAVTGGRRAGAA
jgi:hypothetical protein